jgi:phage terminase large subunit-like protein
MQNYSAYSAKFGDFLLLMSRKGGRVMLLAHLVLYVLLYRSKNVGAEYMTEPNKHCLYNVC